MCLQPKLMSSSFFSLKRELKWVTMQDHLTVHFFEMLSSPLISISIGHQRRGKTSFSQNILSSYPFNRKEVMEEIMGEREGKHWG